MGLSSGLEHPKSYYLTHLLRLKPSNSDFGKSTRCFGSLDRFGLFERLNSELRLWSMLLREQNWKEWDPLSSSLSFWPVLPPKVYASASLPPTLRPGHQMCRIDHLGTQLYWQFLTSSYLLVSCSNVPFYCSNHYARLYLRTNITNF